MYIYIYTNEIKITKIYSTVPYIKFSMSGRANTKYKRRKLF